MSQANPKATTTRRAVLAAAVALPALSLPARAISANATPDPIFAAIAEHWQLYALEVEAYAVSARACELNASASECRKSEQRASKVQSEAFDQLETLVAMTPTTIAGCVAMLQYIGAYIAGPDNECAPFMDYRSPLAENGRTLIQRLGAALASAVQS